VKEKKRKEKKRKEKKKTTVLDEILKCYVFFGL